VGIRNRLTSKSSDKMAFWRVAVEMLLLGNIADSKIFGMEWLTESGASAHMTSCKDAMEYYKSIPISSISISDKTKLQIIGTGNVKMSIMVDGEMVKYTIENVLHVPALGCTLFSKGMTASFGGGIARYLPVRRKSHKEHVSEILSCWILRLTLVSVARPLFRWRRGIRDLVIPTFAVLQT
jgi:hypothetical protein